MAVEEGMRVLGVISLEVRDAETGEIVAQETRKNIVTNAGIAAMAAALNWSGIEDQAAALGISSPTYLAPLYGAVGTGAPTVAAGDTALATELARAIVTQASASSGVVSWSFFFGVTQANGTISEAGVFAGASSTAASGTLLDHVRISPAVTKTNTQTLTLQVSFTLS